MSDIKISVKDFRAVHSADIDLNGITVIAGVNGSGKSTLSRLLYTIFRILSAWKFSQLKKFASKFMIP